MIGIITILGISMICAFLVANKKKKVIRKNAVSFKETMDITNLPIITFKSKEAKLNFILDTGSTKSIIDQRYLENAAYEESNTLCNITGLGRKDKFVKCAVINLTHYDKNFVDEFQVLDMKEVFDSIKESTGANIHGILGTSFFEKYKYVIDFNELIAYSKNEKL